MSFWRTYYHLVWATKNREPFITSEIEPRLFAYLVRKSAELGVYVYEINGWYDHVHMIVAIPPKRAIAYIVKRLKGASSYDLTQAGATFSWQRGYGVLTFGEGQRSTAEAYVRDQKIHHEDETTNAWLERCAEFDEGPESKGIQADGVPPIVAVAERSAGYDVLGEPPF